jgi:hypothetical protein
MTSVKNEAHVESETSTTNILSVSTQGNNNYTNQNFELPPQKLTKDNGIRKKWQQHYNELVDCKKKMDTAKFQGAIL